MSTALANVPDHLTIKVLYSDDDIIVIDKPCNLRSVPGHATEQSDDRVDGNVIVDPNGKSAEEAKPQRLTAQEAWVKAVCSFAPENNDIGEATVTLPVSDKPDNHQDNHQSKAVDELILNLSVTSDTSSIPRKCPVFERYCQRNRRRLLPSFPELDSSEESISTVDNDPPPAKRRKKSYNIPKKLKNIAQIVFSLIQQRQRPLMNLPTPTNDEESAIGQLRLMGFGDYAHNNHGPTETVEEVNKRISSEGKAESDKFKLHVVHRLDCQTSGVMVVARNPDAAADLCEQWRERQSVKKTYLACVKRWPPYHDQKIQEGKIDLSLAASRTERIKWEVRPIDDGGKASLTTWKVHESSIRTNDEKECGPNNDEGLILELNPMTGRTHQLRIHCASVGSGIIGDSLYGDDPIEFVEDKSVKMSTLRLHAHKLTFVHPRSGLTLSYESAKPW